MTQDERWITRYQELRNFIEKEHRNPSKYDDTERGLYYNWLRHNVKLYNNGEMKEERELRGLRSYWICARGIGGRINGSEGKALRETAGNSDWSR